MVENVRSWRGPAAAAGVTLLELMIVVAIVGILAAIAYPSYTQYVLRTNRAVAKSALLQAADRQEQFFADNKRYASDMTQLGYPTNGFMINDEGAVVAGGDGKRIYGLSLANTTATTFTVRAAPQLRQTDDSQCLTMTLTHTGARGQTGAGENCW